MGRCEEDRDDGARLGTPNRDDRGDSEGQRQKEEIKLVAAALNHIVIYIANRDHSEKELRFKLRKNYPNEIIDQALEQAQEQRLLRDPHLISEAVCRALLNKRKSYAFIRGYLNQKGLPTDFIVDEDIEKNLAKHIVQKQFGEPALLTRAQQLKAASRLRSRGFSSASIKAAVFSG